MSGLLPSRPWCLTSLLLILLWTGGILNRCYSQDITPASPLVCVEDSVVFDFQLATDSLVWEWNLGGAFDTISEDLTGIIDTMSSIVITDIPASYDGVEIRVKYIEEGDTLLSDSATLRVGQAPASIDEILSADGFEICSNDTVVLEVGNISLGAYDSIAWYQGNFTGGLLSRSRSTSFSYSNASQTVSIAVRVEGCRNGEGASQLFTFYLTQGLNGINTLAGDETGCPGHEVTLRAQGGTTRERDSVVWYQGDPGLNLQIGKGDTLIYNIDTAQTISAQRVGCRSTDPVSEDFEVFPLPDAPTEVIATLDSGCVGDMITLTVDEPAGDNARFEWYLSPDSISSPVEIGSTFSIELDGPQNPLIYLRRRDTICQALSAPLEKELILVQDNSLLFGNFEDTLCVGEVGVYLADSDGPLSWEFGPDAMPGTAEGMGPHEVLFSSEGPQLVRLRKESSICPSVIEGTVQVYSPPVLTIDDETDYPNEYQVVEGERYTLPLGSEPAGADISWSWQVEFGEVDGPVSGSGQGDLFEGRWSLESNSPQAGIDVEVTVSRFGCDSVFSFKLLVLRRFFVPDLLTPNGDNSNDTWQILFIEDQEIQPDEFTIQLYDRQGTCVCGCRERFTLSDAVNWDGEDLPAGVYWYVIEGSDGFQETGALTLLR